MKRNENLMSQRISNSWSMNQSLHNIIMAVTKFKKKRKKEIYMSRISGIIQ